MDIDEDYVVESKGIFSLKGKDNVIGLFSIKERNLSSVLDISKNRS